MNRFLILLKREFWEHKGGMLWAPLVVGAVMLGIGALSALLGPLAGGRGGLRINGQPLLLEGDWLAGPAQQAIADNLALAVVPAMVPFSLTLALVLFFYTLGALYDERRDRSLLFWKSMPVSDAATVLSKLATALLLAPLIAAAVGLTVGLLIALGAAIGLAALGASAVLPSLLTNPDIYLAPLAVAALLPVFALWALPSVAWCLAISAWARRAPFLWAAGLPLGLAVLLSWQEALLDRRFGAEWFWENVVARLFGGFVPGLWFAFSKEWESLTTPEPASQGLPELIVMSYATLAEPALWIGLAIGLMLVGVTVRLRRWREDAA